MTNKIRDGNCLTGFFSQPGRTAIGSVRSRHGPAIRGKPLRYKTFGTRELWVQWNSCVLVAKITVEFIGFLHRTGGGII